MHAKGRHSCSRRSFLQGSGLTLAGFGLSSLLPGAFVRQALAAGAGDERLIFIFLRGGNDGLNAVIPHGDPDYNAINRQGIYIAPGEAIDLNGFASLHPAMSDLMDGFNAGDLAVIHRVGYPDSSQSHFTGQRIWENGDPAQSVLFEGWLARYIFEQAQAFSGDVPVITAQPATPLLVRGKQAFINISDASGFYELPGWQQARFIRDWRKTFSELEDSKPYRSLLSQAGVRLMDTQAIYESWNQVAWDPKDPDNPTWSLFPVSDATNPPDASRPNGLKFDSSSYDFFLNLKLIALAMLESSGTRVGGTELQGFDLHGGQGGVAGRHAALLSWLAYGMRSLRIVLSGAAIDPRAYSAVWDKTVVTTMSEFGRTSKTNGSLGTDHAEASCMWVTGGNVAGGVYNCDAGSWPAGVMFARQGRYLQYETDFRAVFWEIMRDHMGALPAEVETLFPGYTAGGMAAQELGLV